MGEQFTYAQRQRAIQLTALAYYLNGKAQQYDSAPLTYLPPAQGGNKRQSSYVSPEEATEQRTVYTVCSSFVYEVYYNALGYSLGGAQISVATHPLFNDPPRGTAVFREDFDAPTMTREEAMERFRKTLEAGDVIIALKRNGFGHALIYAGDIDGDGIPKVIHSTGFGGGKYNMETGEDRVEPYGDIRKDPAEGMFCDGKQKPSYYIMADDMLGIEILRPLLGEAGKMPLTEAAKARLRFPGLQAGRTVDTGYYGAAPYDGKMTVTVTVSNHSKRNYRDIPVMQTIPEGTELRSAKRAMAAGRSLLWSIDLGPGETRSLSYTVKVVAEPGCILTAEGGTAAGLPLPELQIRVARPLPKVQKLDRVRSYRKLVEAEGPRGIAFAESVYRAALGWAPALPDPAELFDNLFDPLEGASVPAYIPRVKNMSQEELTVRGFFGGRLIVTPSANDRVLDLRPADLAAGDIVLFSEEMPQADTVSVWVRTGRELIGMKGGRVETVPEKEFTALLTKGFFVALRPSQVFDPAAEEAAAKA